MFAIFFIFALAINSIFATNYCDRSLCPFRGPHIGCNNRGQFGPSCRSTGEVIDLSRLRDRIVAKHNELRNKIATGQERPYRTASQMATMTWDDELAQLALLNVKQCEMNHDACHNTHRYKMSGQNLAWWSSSSATEADPGVVEAVNDWYSEHKDANNDVIQSFHSVGRVITHFTGMMIDKNNKVGCAAVKAKLDGMYNYFVACNYAVLTMMNQPVYKFGQPASRCKTGRNPQYPGLCSVNEKYDY